MKKLSITLFSLIITYCCIGQTNSKIFGTWVHYKTIVDKQEVTYEEGVKYIDTLMLAENTFEQRVLWTNDTFYIQTGIYYMTKNKLTLKNRVTSIPKQGEQFPDVEFTYKIRNEELILGQRSEFTNGDKIERSIAWQYYKRII